jgi:hypothetical protein
MKLGEINRTMVASGIASMHKGRDTRYWAGLGSLQATSLSRIPRDSYLS